MKKEDKKVVLKEVGTSITKGTIGAIPYVGTILNEFFFDTRGRIKQNRINRFLKMLQNYMESVSENYFDFEHIKSEEFGDIFESILNRITKTRSEEKMKRFKKVLISEMHNPSNTEFIETFLDIISRLEEIQIKILQDIQIATENCGGLHEKVYKLQNEINFFSNKKQKSNKDELILSEKNDILRRTLNTLATNQKYYDPRNYGLDLSQYQFYTQDLISKALLHERLIPRNKIEPAVTKIIEISTYGKEFLHFIEDKG